MKKEFIMVFLVFCCGLLQAQSNKSSNLWIRETLEKLLENQQTNLDYADLELRMQEWASDPIPIHIASKEELASLYFLTSGQIRNIIIHREKYGKLLSKYELQCIEGIDPETAELLSYFVKLDESTGSDQLSWKEMFQKGTQEWIYQTNYSLQKSRGYFEPSGFMGSPFQVSTRYRFQYKSKLLMGFGMEKDAGERWDKFGDFQTAHIFYKRKGLLQTIALGDFQTNFGSGLTFGTALFNGKSARIFQTQNYAEGFRPCRSLNESGFMRGLGLGFKINGIQLDFWLSLSPLSATIQYDSLLKEDRLAGIGLSGLHRTRNEILKKNTAIQQLAGCHLKYTFKNGNLGTLVNTSNRYFLATLNGNLLEQIISPTHIIMGLYAHFRLQNKSLNGEFSKQVNGANAFTLNGIFPLHSKLDLMLIYRSFEPAFNNAFSNAWSALSTIGNESGLYTALAYRPQKNRQWNIYSDWFKSLAPRYQCSLPGKGTDYFVNYSVQYSKTFQIEYRFRYTQNDKNIPSEIVLAKTIHSETRYQFRFQFNYQWNEANNFQFRAEKIFAQKTDNSQVDGLLHYYDLNHQPKKGNWSLRGRICIFQTTDYLARMYMFESDLPYNYVQSQLNGNGTKYYLIWEYRLNRHWQLHLKLSNLQMTDLDKIGNGIDEINSGNQTEFRVQLKWKI